jgi:hypothetical protein
LTSVIFVLSGVFPYEYCSSIKKMRKTHEMPAKKHFYSSLTNSNISDDDYAHSQQVWKVYKCKDLVSYCELYCKIDVAGLAEIVTQFRKVVLDNFDLDCCHYISTPQLAYDCMLFKTGVKIELLHDINMVSSLLTKCVVECATVLFLGSLC